MKLSENAKVALYVILLSLSGRISFDLPIGNGIPITAQSYIVIVCSYFLNWRKSMLSVCIFLLLGSIGLPVLADGGFGISKIFGKTGGYLLGFLLASGVVSYFEFGNKRTIFKIMSSFLIATLTILIIGSIVLSFFIGIESAYKFGFEPFVIGGVIKCVLGVITVELVDFNKNFKTRPLTN